MFTLLFVSSLHRVICKEEWVLVAEDGCTGLVVAAAVEVFMNGYRFRSSSFYVTTWKHPEFGGSNRYFQSSCYIYQTMCKLEEFYRTFNEQIQHLVNSSTFLRVYM